MNKLSFADGTDPETLTKMLDNNSSMDQLLGLLVSILLSNPKMLFDIKKYSIRVKHILILDFGYSCKRYAYIFK
jgi:hypothetical protein